MSLVKGMQKGHHLEVTSAGVVVEVKNSKGCCNSKKVTLETQRDRLAIAALADRLTKGTGLNEDMLELYAAVRNKEKHVDSLISGFFNWLKSIFRSKTYKIELKLLRSELQKFGILFDQHRMIEAIKVKYFGAGYVASPAADKKAFDELRKVVPALFNNKPADFKNAPFYIRQEGFKYSVVLPSADTKQPSKTVPIDRLDQLPGIHLRAHAKELFEAVKSESAAISVVSDTECENSVGKVELSYPEERDLNKNELSITYYDPAVGRVCKKVDLSTFNSVADLKAVVNACRQESTNSKANIQVRHADLQGLINGLNLTLETSLTGKEYIVRTQGSAPKAVSLPFGLSLDEHKQQLELKLQNVYLDEYHRLYPAEAGLISSDEFYESKTWSEWEKFGFALDLEEREFQLHYFNFKNGDEEYLPWPTSKIDKFATKIHKQINKIEEKRVQKQNTISEICKQSQTLAMDDDAKCLKAVGQVEIIYNKTNDNALIKYYHAEQHKIIEVDEVVIDIATFKKLVEDCQKASSDSYESVKARLDAINLQLPDSFSVSYDFAGKLINLNHSDGTTQTVLESFPMATSDDVIVKKAEELVVPTRKTGFERTINNPNLTVETSADGKEFIFKTAGDLSKEISISTDLSLKDAESELEQKLEALYIAECGLITSKEFERTKTLTLREREKIGLSFDLSALIFNIYFYNFTQGEYGFIEAPVTLNFADDLKAVKEAINTITAKRKEKKSSVSAICNHYKQPIEIDDDEKSLTAVGQVEIIYDEATDRPTFRYYDAAKHQIISNDVLMTSLKDLKDEIEACKQASLDSYKPIKERLEAINAKLPELFCASYDFVNKQINLYERDGAVLTALEALELTENDYAFRILELCSDYIIRMWRGYKDTLTDQKYKGFVVNSASEYNNDSKCLARICAGNRYSIVDKKIYLSYFDHSKRRDLELSLSSSKEENCKRFLACIDQLLEERSKDTRASIALAEVLRKELFSGNLFINLADLVRDLVSNTTDTSALLKQLSEDGALPQYGIKFKPECKTVRKLLAIYPIWMNTRFHDANKAVKGSELAKLLSQYVPQIQKELGIPTS